MSGTVHLSYNQQINNSHNNHRTLRMESERLIFNGPIYGYTHHVSGKGTVICYSQNTHTGPPNNTGLKETSSRTSGSSSLSVEQTSEDLCYELFNGSASASLARSFERGEFPIERSVFEAEYQVMSRDMQLYVKHLLDEYTKRNASEPGRQ